jgi:hypothetical protein
MTMSPPRSQLTRRRNARPGDARTRMSPRAGAAHGARRHPSSSQFVTFSNTTRRLCVPADRESITERARRCLPATARPGQAKLPLSFSTSEPVAPGRRSTPIRSVTATSRSSPRRHRASAAHSRRTNSLQTGGTIPGTLRAPQFINVMLHHERTLGATTPTAPPDHHFSLLELLHPLHVSIRLSSQIRRCHRASAVHKHGKQGCKKIE